MRTLPSIAVATFLGIGTLTAQEADPDKAVSGGGNLPAGWEARTDNGNSTENVKFVAMGGGYHVTLGPRTIFYRPADATQGNYIVTATFTQTKAPAHAEAFGLIIGGSDLQGDSQRYSYFLIRGNGQYLVKNRNGSETTSVSGSWTSNDAIQAQDADGKCTNTLTVLVSADQVRFLINDQEVFAASPDMFQTDGIPGIRVNHNLDMHIGNFAVTAG